MIEDESRKIFAANLNRLMQLNNKKQGDLSNDLRIKQTTLSDWVNAKKFPRIDKIEMLANYFNVKKSDLIEQKNNEKNPPQDLKKILEGKNIKYNGRVMSEEEKKFVEKMLANMYYQAKELNDKKE